MTPQAGAPSAWTPHALVHPARVVTCNTVAPLRLVARCIAGLEANAGRGVAPKRQRCGVAQPDGDDECRPEASLSDAVGASPAGRGPAGGGGSPSSSPVLAHGAAGGSPCLAGSASVPACVTHTPPPVPHDGSPECLPWLGDADLDWGLAAFDLLRDSDGVDEALAREAEAFASASGVSGSDVVPASCDPSAVQWLDSATLLWA